MYLLITDETNKEPTEKAPFFMYGGLFVPGDKAGLLHDGIQTARLKAGYLPGDLLKFDTNVRPKQVTREVTTQLKKDVIELCIGAGCKFSVLVLHHKIANRQDSERKVLWSASHIIGHFNYFLLTEVNDHGLVLADRLPVKAPDQYLAELFASGLELPDGRRQKLDRVIGLASTCLGASHLCSAIDVVLGTFRFCVNNLSDDPKVTSMLRSVARMLWCREQNGIKYARERGLLVRPKTIKVPTYQKDYDDLVSKMEAIIRDV